MNSTNANAADNQFPNRRRLSVAGRQMLLAGLLGSAVLALLLVGHDDSTKESTTTQESVAADPAAAIPSVQAHTAAAAAMGTGAAPPKAGSASADSFPIDLTGQLRHGLLSLESLLERSANDAQFRDQLRSHYRLADDAEVRATLLQLIAAAPIDEQLDFSDQLLAEGDAEHRADGYRLLAGLPLDEENERIRVARSLHDEQDPAALAALVGSMQPGLLAAEDAGPIAAQLFALSRDAQPQVRASALPQLAHWVSAEQLEAPCFDALADPDPTVRTAAVAAIAVARVHSPRLLNALFELASNAEEDAERRREALQATLGFSLTRSEIALYRLLQAELPLHPSHG